MNANIALDQLGHFGLYQLFVFIVSCIPVLNSGLTLISTVFISGTPDHRCFIEECDARDESSQVFALNNTFSVPVLSNSCKRFLPITQNYSSQSDSLDRCYENWFSNESQNCDHYVFSKREFHSTIVTEWRLVCDESWKVPMSQSIIMCGVLFGNLFFGQFSDRYGRKALFTFVPLICLVSSVSTAFAPNFTVFAILTAITAACISGMSQASFIIGIEFIGAKYRVLCANLQEVIYSVGTALLSLIAYEVRDWRPFQLIISVPIVITLFYPWLFPESIRWQASHGKINKALNTLRKAAKCNGLILNEPAFTDNKPLNESSSSSQSSASNGRHYGPLDLIRHKTLRFWSINLFVIWLIDSMIFYGLTFQSSSLGSNTYITLAAISMVDIPANILVTIAMTFWGRKPVLFSCSLMAGLSCLATIFVVKSSPFFTVIAIFGKTNIAAAYTLMYVYSAEIFPTVIRSTSVGLCTVFARVGGIIAPHLIELSFLGNSIPLVLCGVLSLVCCVLTINLPETFGKQLPDTLEDINFLADSFNESEEKTKIIKYSVKKYSDDQSNV